LRRFSDEEGREWEVVAGRESWGSIVAIFIPCASDVPMRQAPAPAAGYEEAGAWMDTLSEDELRTLLTDSIEKPG